jgi:DNA-binding MarR family transcriptional regulator
VLAVPPVEEYRRAAALRAALRKFARESERITRAHGLTSQRYELLLMIKASDEPSTVTRLCEPLQLGQSGVTQLVQRAEDLGLIARRALRGDARSHELRLTPKGERLLERAFLELGPERDRLTQTLRGRSARRGTDR